MQNKYKIDQRGQDVSFGQAFKDSWRGLFSFSGYTTRKGYWLGVIGIYIPIFLLYIFVFPLLLIGSEAAVFLSIYLSFGSLLAYIPIFIGMLALRVRRLRDAGINNQGIVIYIISLCLLVFIPLINVVLVVLDLYIMCQPSGRFLTDEKNHPLFSNREKEQQIDSVVVWQTGKVVQQTKEADSAENLKEKYKTSNPITPELQKDLDEMVMGVSSYVSPSDTDTRASDFSSPIDVSEGLRNPDGTPYSSVYSQKSPVKFIIIGMILLGILFIAFLSVLVTKNKNVSQDLTDFAQSTSLHSIPIDISNYDVVVYTDGESGYGTAEVEITSIPYYEGYDEEIEQLLWNPTITISKDSGLSNGDVVTVRIELDQDELERLGLDATGIYEQDVTINTLDEPYVASSTTVSQEDWPLSKQNELAQYMIQFGNEMNQPNYQRIAITKPVVWSGRELDENFKILDGYEYWYDNYTKVHRYIFVVNITGEPVVLYSKDTGDPEFYIVSLTQNEMLPIAFREIYY